MNERDKMRAGLGVAVEGVHRAFEGGVVALAGLDLYVPAGQFVALLGPSGCGKSTLLRLIAGLDRPDRGWIEIEDVRSTGVPPVSGGEEHGRDARATNLSKPPIFANAEEGSYTTKDNLEARPGGSPRSIAYVFQDPHLMPWRTVVGNVALPLELRGVARSARRFAAETALEQVGLGDALHRYPAQLSGGMRMRASLARALVTNPRLLLLDEPFAALDEITRQKLDEQLYDLWRQRGMTVIFVTHSVAEATYLSQRAVVFTPRPARIVLDHNVNLPMERPALLRGEASFSRESRVLYEALERGGSAGGVSVGGESKPTGAATSSGGATSNGAAASSGGMISSRGEAFSGEGMCRGGASFQRDATAGGGASVSGGAISPATAPTISPPLGSPVASAPVSTSRPPPPFPPRSDLAERPISKSVQREAR